MRFAGVGERIILTLWVGGLWAVGYLAVPVLFSSLDDRQVAGALAGQMFSAMFYFGLVSGLLLLAAGWWGQGARFIRQWPSWVLLAMVALVAVSLFAIQPAMQELKVQGLAQGSAEAAQFGRLHGISSAMYLVTSLLGLALVAFGPRLTARADGSVDQRDPLS